MSGREMSDEANEKAWSEIERSQGLARENLALCNQLDALQARHDRLRKAAEAAYDWLTDPERGGHHKDNPIPAALRAALGPAVKYASGKKRKVAKNTPPAEVLHLWAKLGELEARVKGAIAMIDEWMGECSCGGGPEDFCEAFGCSTLRKIRTQLRGGE